MPDGVRKDQRHDSDIPVVWANAARRQAGRGRLVNYSHGGALIEIDQRLAIGDSITLVSAELASLPPRASVQWCQPLPKQLIFQCGVSFERTAVEAVRWNGRDTKASR